ncbi:methyltransferase family protein [Haloactinospora alba]|uniref:Methyltransferase family protein n=1 Tax=Haloactinospora alba TaxID=405555 RepID=A0A543N8X6_9ACTN|nr:class I SAM-dependent methyltransferase [Haloactinospora alba]TQN28273.1 methyltransferase family protein [Haloactinospora alba]
MEQEDWDERYRSSELVWGAEPNQFVVEMATELSPGRALDLAAGEGRNAAWLAERGWRVTATEFSSVAIDRGKRLAAAREVDVDWVYADAREYAPEPGAFDLVLLAYLHLPPEEWDRVLRGAVRALAPDGRLISVGHDRDNLVHGTGGPSDPDILHRASEISDTITDAAVKAGYPVWMRRAGRVTREAMGESGPWIAIDTLVTADRATPPARAL